MEKAVVWAVQKVVEDVDDSVTMAALLGAGLDSAAFVAVGLPAQTAVVAGAVTGVGFNICKKVRKGEKR